MIVLQNLMISAVPIYLPKFAVSTKWLTPPFLSCHREYAALVSSRVQSIGLVTQTQHLSPTVSLADALDDAAQQGLLYAVIITSQHELHRSVTLTILHGRNPQGEVEFRQARLVDPLGHRGCLGLSVLFTWSTCLLAMPFSHSPELKSQPIAFCG